MAPITQTQSLVKLEDATAFDLDSLADSARMYCARPEELANPEVFQSWLPILSEEERTRLDRFYFDHSKREFLAGKILTRTILGSLLSVPPASLDFDAEENGKPSLKSINDLNLTFNLSHTKDLVALIVCRDLRVGIDVETMDPNHDCAGVAERFFSGEENAFLRQFSGEGLIRSFFRVWTLKEAFIKAKGTGMTLSLQEFSVKTDKEALGATISFASALHGKPEDWQLGVMELEGRHSLAWAIERPARPDLVVRLSQVCLQPEGKITG